MQKVIHFFVVVLLSSVKFIVGPSLVYLDERYEPEFGFIQANIAIISGGMLGVVVFMYFSKWLLKMYRLVRKKTKRFFSKESGEFYYSTDSDVTADIEVHYKYIERGDEKKNIFNRRSRRFVRIWQKYGLVGLAALTPILFSIPVGTFIMARLESNRKKILLYMFISIVCWSLLLTTLFELTNARSIHEILQ